MFDQEKTRPNPTIRIAGFLMSSGFRLGLNVVTTAPR
jgi:hypothetical protein